MAGELKEGGWAYQKPRGRPKGSLNKPKPEEHYRDRPHGNYEMGTGNYTRGTARKGYRGGRKALYREGEASLVSFKLSDAEIALAVYLGEGAIPKGVRRALAAMRRDVPGIPRTRNEAERLCERSSIAVNKLLRDVFRTRFAVMLPVTRASARHLRAEAGFDWLDKGPCDPPPEPNFKALPESSLPEPDFEAREGGDDEILDMSDEALQAGIKAMEKAAAADVARMAEGDAKAAALRRGGEKKVESTDWLE